MSMSSKTHVSKLTSIVNRLLSRETEGLPSSSEPLAGSHGDDLQDADTLREISELELISRRVVDGILSGRHRSTHRGGCCEFTQHRPYTRGDELRLIDWQIYARRDRYYVRQYEEETNLQALLILDASGSMGFGLSTPSKLTLARHAAACLARLLLRQRDAVGLAVADDRTPGIVPARQKASHLGVILQTLAETRSAGTTSLCDCLRESASRVRRGMLLVFSDCFGDVPELGSTLRYLKARGHDVILFHTLAPEELAFEFRQPMSFQSLEVAGDQIDTDPAALREAYLERFGQFLDDLQRAAAAAGCDYHRLITSDDLNTSLGRYLRRRRAKGHSEPRPLQEASLKQANS